MADKPKQRDPRLRRLDVNIQKKLDRLDDLHTDLKDDRAAAAVKRAIDDLRKHFEDLKELSPFTFFHRLK